MNSRASSLHVFEGAREFGVLLAGAAGRRVENERTRTARSLQVLLGRVQLVCEVAHLTGHVVRVLRFSFFVFTKV